MLLTVVLIAIAALRTPDMVHYLAAVFRGQRPTSMQTFHAIVWSTAMLCLFA